MMTRNTRGILYKGESSMFTDEQRSTLLVSSPAVAPPPIFPVVTVAILTALSTNSLSSGEIFTTIDHLIRNFNVLTGREERLYYFTSSAWWGAEIFDGR